jgi:hypothetical protein
MNRLIKILAAIIVIVALLVFVDNASSTDPNQPPNPPKQDPNHTPNTPAKEIVARGTVIEITDRNGKLSEVKLLVNRTMIYQITLNVKGKELGRKMAGKFVRVIGTPDIKGSTKWLTIRDYDTVRLPPAKKPA